MVRELKRVRTGDRHIRTNLGSIRYKLQLSEPGRSAWVQIKLELGNCVTAGANFTN